MYLPENNINNEFSLHNSKDFLVVMPEILYVDIEKGK